jgi:threonine dehydrogenase-like Zn-dependent dehydrogenase
VETLVYVAPERMELQDAPAPAPGPDEAVLRVRAAGVCGSDVHGYLGRSLNRTPPLVMGHEFAGTVASTGAGVRDLPAGTPAAVYPFITCGRCAACRRGETSLCASRRIIGIHRPGGFAEFAAVPRASVVPLPPGLPLLAASFAEPLAVAVHAFSRHAGALLRRLAVVGCGTQGLLALQLAARGAPSALFAVDVIPARLRLATAMGATRTLDAGADAVVQEIRNATDGEGVDLAIEAAGSTAARQMALASVRAGGTVVFLGLGDEISPLNAVDIVNREVAVRGSYAYTYEDFRRALELLAQNAVRVDWARSFPLRAGPEVFRRLATAPGEMVKAVLTPAD